MALTTDEITTTILDVIERAYYPKVRDDYASNKEASLSSLDLDSLDTTELEIHLEEEFGIDLSKIEGIVSKEMTIGDIVKIVQGKL